MKKTVKQLKGLHFLIVITLMINNGFSQCVAISDSSGVIYNTTLDSVDYYITISSTCSFLNIFIPSACGIAFPALTAPWSGNTNGTTSTITYTFSVPITSVDLLIGAVGINGPTNPIVPESFIFTTNSSSPSLVVNSGSCAPWIIVGNQTISPSIVGAVNAIHTISSLSQFTSFTITTNSSGVGPTGNGGSLFSLCSASIISGVAFSLGNDTNLCQGETLMLDVFKQNSTYLWQDNSTNSTFNVTQAGSYWVEMTVNNITTVDTINVSYSSPSSIQLGIDTALCEGETLIIDASTINATYLWQDNSTKSTFNVYQQGTYWVQVNNNCGTGSDTIEVAYKDCSTVLEMPNIFTPNGDNNNDLFLPLQSNGIKSSQLIIFNRWGQELFISKQLMHGWDGRTTSGIEVPNGTYFWLINYIDQDSNKKTLKGYVSLCR